MLALTCAEPEEGDELRQHGMSIAEHVRVRGMCIRAGPREVGEDRATVEEYGQPRGHMRCEESFDPGRPVRFPLHMPAIDVEVVQASEEDIDHGIGREPAQEKEGKRESEHMKVNIVREGAGVFCHLSRTESSFSAQGIILNSSSSSSKPLQWQTLVKRPQTSQTHS